MTVTISNGFFRRLGLENKQLLDLKEEVKSLKHDWLMCDEACDHKEEKNRELLKLAKEVVKYEEEFDDELAIAIANLKKYLDNQIVTKIRTDMSNEEKQKLSEKYIDVREKNKPWVRKLNPNYKPNNRRRTT